MAEEKQGNTDAGGAVSADDKPKTGAAKTEKVVRYTGMSDVREIDSASFTRVGVEDQNKVVWDAGNNHTVKASELSKAAVEFLSAESDFVVEDVEL